MNIKNSHQTNSALTPSEIDELVISTYPYPIAVNYRRILEAKDWERRTRESIRVFEFSIRFITLQVLCQYLIRDLDEFSDPELTQQLYKQKLSKLSLGTW